MTKTNDDIELDLSDDPISEDDERLLKVIIVGDTSVGKTMLSDRYIHGKFGIGQPTIGAEFALKHVTSRDMKVKLQLWSISGCERVRKMTSLYYKNASACVILFDITHRRTFENVAVWKDDIDSKTSLSNGKPIPCLLLANKTDKPEHDITDEEIEELCMKYNFIGWRKISVRENTNIEESMNFLVEETLLHLPM
ncbi:ras-related protein Rab-7L1-like [Lytechinus pictus]|uniref:ras-related protein Rab-7L1-like n=1 Tax=Lytechinus pictus TaxID=7653 RepID=UPI00240D3CE9|nr:ras-related protein Rab-7L1-like [Lytechinus pictus]